MSNNKNDTELFLATLNGSEIDADELYNRYKNFLTRYIYRLHADIGIILDFDECLSLYDEFFALSLGTYNQHISPFKSYLFRVTRNGCYSSTRRFYSKHPKKNVELDKEILDSDEELRAFYGQHESRYENVYQLVFCSPEFENLSLSKQQKLVLYMRAEGYTLSDIASVTGLSISKIRRIVAKLKNSKQLYDTITEMD